MIILGVDPGPVESAWVLYDTETKGPVNFAKEPNDDFLSGKLSHSDYEPQHLYMEMIANYGMPVGKDVFETCVWIGRYVQHWVDVHASDAWTLVYRREVKMHLCNTNRAKDSNITQAIANRYAGTVQKAKGTKKKPGPLYGVKSDIWAALGVAITAAETKL